MLSFTLSIIYGEGGILVWEKTQELRAGKVS